MQTPPELSANSEEQKCEINAQVDALLKEATKERPDLQSLQAIGGELDAIKRQAKAALSKERSSRSKDELAYWKAAIRQIPDSPYWYAELQREGVRRKISLETSNKAAAAHRAREIWYEVRALGWKGYLAKYKPESLPNADPSIGQFITAVEAVADVEPKTLRSYVSALRKIAADIAGLADDTSKFGRGKKRKAWLERVDAVKLSTLSADAIQAWKRSFVAAAEHDPISQRSRKVSCNSYLRSAKSLFAPRILAHVKLELPDPLPFSSAQLEPRPSCKYRSTFDIAQLTRSATEELAHRDIEAFKVFLLCAMLGLRRLEADLLPWTAFRWDEGILRIETTEFFSAKSEDSLGDIAVDREVVELFKSWHRQASGPFVIESDQQPRPGLTYNYYRADAVFDRLIEWLRAHGVSSRKPLHELRKQFGSEICRHFGIFAASQALRHADIKITTAYYVENRVRATPQLGHLLAPDKIVEFKQEVA